MKHKTLNFRRGLFLVILALSLLSLSGCFLGAPDVYAYDTETLGGFVALIIRLAFTRPWILLPALWHAMKSDPGGGFMGGFLSGLTHALFVLPIGGIHIGIGALLMRVSKNKNDFFQSLGSIFVLYGLFIWLSCFVVGVFLS